jgi:alpha-tubulin suppressor-like RCC1 family protein
VAAKAAFGTLGNGTTDSNALPVPVTGVTRAKAISVHGHRHVCTATTDEKVQCWGSNEYGQLGDGSTTDGWVPVGVDVSTADGG